MSMDDAATSVDGVAIRLTDERWQHIVDRHPEMKDARSDVLETIRNPDRVQRGDDGAKLAIRFFEGTSVSDKHLVVIYRENGEDGFVITAYYATDPAVWRETLWTR